jgi:hypothetical protein
MLNLIQHLYKLSIYRPQIPGRARNDNRPSKQTPSRWQKAVTLAQNRHAERTCKQVISASVQSQHLPSTDSGSSSE